MRPNFNKIKTNRKNAKIINHISIDVCHWPLTFIVSFTICLYRWQWKCITRTKQRLRRRNNWPWHFAWKVLPDKRLRSQLICVSQITQSKWDQRQTRNIGIEIGSYRVNKCKLCFTTLWFLHQERWTNRFFGFEKVDEWSLVCGSWSDNWILILCFSKRIYGTCSDPGIILKDSRYGSRA